LEESSLAREIVCLRKKNGPTLRCEHISANEDSFRKVTQFDSMTRMSFTRASSRGEDELILVESVNDFTPPHVYQKGREVDVHEIGYRNSQIQHDKLKGD
jgi:hypothetical protein